MRVLRLAAKAAATNSRVEPVVLNFLVCFNDHIVALADSHEEAVLADRLDGDEIGSDDGEAVAYQRDSEGVVYGGVDEPETVLFARGQPRLLVLAASAEWIDVFAVEEDVVTRRRTGWNKLGLTQKVICSSIVPIADNEWAEVNIVVSGRRSVDLDGACNAVAVLGGKVAVIPEADALVGGSKSATTKKLTYHDVPY